MSHDVRSKKLRNTGEYTDDYITIVVNAISGKCAMETHKFQHNTYFKFREYLGDYRNKTDLRKSRVYANKGESAGRKTKKGEGLDSLTEEEEPMQMFSSYQKTL